jgi:GNAT superfamily N-acetyltransferase
MIVVESLANHPDLISEMVDIAWTEWGDALTEEDRQRWLREAERDCRQNSIYSAGFVALSGDELVGAVQLHEFDLDHMRDRSPWVCGMVVKPEYRGHGVGRRLLQALESFAAAKGVKRLWVFTESAPAFYESCGWSPYAEAVNNGEAGMILTKQLEPGEWNAWYKRMIPIADALYDQHLRSLRQEGEIP